MVEFASGRHVDVDCQVEGLIQAGSSAVGAGEAVIGVDAVLGYAELQKCLSLGGQVLAVGGAAGVSDAGCGHEGSVRIGVACAIVAVPFI